MSPGKQHIPGVVLLFCLACVPCVVTTGNCVDIGFSSNLLCSSCRELKEFNLEALEDDCERCCQADGVNSDENVIKNRLHTQPSLKYCPAVIPVKIFTIYT